MLDFLLDPKFIGLVVATAIALVSSCITEREDPNSGKKETIIEFPRSRPRLILFYLSLIGAVFALYSLHLSRVSSILEEEKLTNIDNRTEETKASIDAGLSDGLKKTQEILEKSKMIPYYVSLSRMRAINCGINIPTGQNWLYLSGYVKVGGEYIYTSPRSDSYPFYDDINNYPYLQVYSPEKPVIYKRRNDPVNTELHVSISIVNKHSKLDFNRKYIRLFENKEIISGEVGTYAPHIQKLIKSNKYDDCELEMTVTFEEVKI